MNSLMSFPFGLIFTFAALATVLGQAHEPIVEDFISLLGLKRAPTVEERSRLIDLKRKSDSASLSTKEREAAYAELFELVFKLQGNLVVTEGDRSTLKQLASTAAAFPPGVPRMASGWSTSTTPDGKLGHVEKMGRGPIPLILIPNQESWAVYRSFMEANLDRFTMYAITLPGYGTTPPPPPPIPYELKELAWWKNAEAAVVNLIREERIEKPIIAGIMYGAYLAARLAVNHPEKISAAIMINGLVYANDKTSLAERQKLYGSGIAAFPASELVPWSRRPPADAVRKAIDASPESLTRIANWARDPEQAKSIVIDATTGNHPTVGRYGSELATTDLTDELKRLMVPILVLPAMSDKDLPYQGRIALTQFEEIKATYPDIPLTIKPVPDVRQYVLFEAADRLTDEIETFVSNKDRKRNSAITRR